MGDLLKSVVTGLLIAVFGTMVLSELGVDIAPIIASAGIIGIAWLGRSPWSGTSPASS